MIVIRSRKRRVALLWAAVAEPFGRSNRPLRSLPTVGGADMGLSCSLVSQYGHAVRNVINKARGKLSSDFSSHGRAVHGIRSGAMPRSEGNGAASVAVLGKAMALIDGLAEVGAATPAQLAELTGEPRSTVYRLLSNLQGLELVEPGPRRGTFVLGLKLFRLGRTVVSRFDERQAALPVMERIHDELGENIFLCVRRGYDAVCIERLDGTRVNMLALSLGGSLPLHAGGASRALLAFEPEAFWEEYLEHGLPEALTDRTPATRAALLEE